MEKWEEKTNNEISVRLIEMVHEHENLKQKILIIHDAMVALEKDYKKGQNVLNSRIKRTFKDE